MQNLDKRLNACFLKIIEGNEGFCGERRRLKQSVFTYREVRKRFTTERDDLDHTIAGRIIPYNFNVVNNG